MPEPQRFFRGLVPQRMLAALSYGLEDKGRLLFQIHSRFQRWNDGRLQIVIPIHSNGLIKHGQAFSRTGNL